MARAARVDRVDVDLETADDIEIEPPVMLPLPEKPAKRASRSRAGGAVCPTCMSQAHVEKVSHVVRSGRGRLFWENGEIAHYETELSQLLDAPQKPRDVPILRAVLGLVTPFLLLGLTLAVLTVLRSQDYFDIPARYLDTAQTIALAWFGVVIPLALVVNYIKSRLDLRKKLPVWRVAHRRWSALYYCGHDDVVFEPNLRAVAAPREVDALLYSGIPAPQPHHARPLIKALSAAGIVLVVLGGSIAGLTSSTSAEQSAVSPEPAQEESSEAEDVSTQPAQSTQPGPAPPAVPVTNRSNCDQIRGTAYLSPDERTWYLANCLQP